MRLSLCLVMMVFALNGCLYKQVREAKKATAHQNWDSAYRMWDEILQEDPGNPKAKLERERARVSASLEHLRKATLYLERDLIDEATFELNVVKSLDPYNAQVDVLQDRIIERRKRLAQQQQTLEERAQNPETDFSNLPSLSPKSWGPLNIYFPKPTDIEEIYRAIGQAYEVNIVVDPKIRSEKLALDLRNLNFLKAVDTLMVLNRHFFKVVDDNTIIILEDNKTNRDRYDNMLLRTFYLSNITPKDLKAHLRQLGLKEFAENEKLNAITVKGTPEQIALAEKVITANDKSQAEVVIEVELLEVNKSNMQRLGMVPINPTNGQAQYQVGIIADPVDRSDADADAGGLRGVFPSLDSQDLLTLVPAVAIDFLKERGDSTQVANPHLRVSSGEEAEVRIGQSIPIANTSFTNANLSGSSGGSNNFGDQALTSFNYNDVGIRIKVTPRVHYNGEVTMVLELEITSVVSGGLQPILGKRLVTTTLRLRNGETNVLAGLLNSDERNSLSGIPGLSDIPILGKLFTNDERIANQTDIIMTVRPVIVRGPNITPEDRAPYEISQLGLSSLYAKAKQAESEPKDKDWSLEGSNAKQGSVANAPGEAGVYVPESATSDMTPTQPPAYDQPRNVPAVQDSDVDMAEPTAEDSDDAYDVPEEEEELPSPAMLSFTPPGQNVRQDDFFEYDLFVTNVNELKRGELRLTFDPNVIQIEGVEVGRLFNAQNQRPLLTPAWNNAEGVLSLVITQRKDAPTFSGSGILAQIRVRALAPGEGTFNFDQVTLLDGEGGNLVSMGLEGRYEVSP